MPAPRSKDEAAAANEATRLRRLREDTRRPISVNLAEAIAVSHELIELAANARVDPERA